VSWPSDQLLLASCGVCAGAGVYLACRALAAGRPSLAADRAALHAPPEPEESPGWGADTGRQVTELLRRLGLEQALLTDDLAMVGRTAEAHTTARLVHALLGASLGALALLAVTFVAPFPLPLAGVAALFSGLLGVLAADRPVRRLATARRQEAQLAVAAYIDLVRILLVGGLPLHADSGSESWC